MLLVFVTLVLVINALVGERGLTETLRARRQHQELVGSIERLRTENARLRDEARRLRTDPATIEALARQELGLIKPGEMLFIIKDAKSGSIASQLASSNIRTSTALPTRQSPSQFQPSIPIRELGVGLGLVGRWECLGAWDLELGSCRVSLQHFCMQE